LAFGHRNMSQWTTRKRARDLARHRPASVGFSDNGAKDEKFRTT
jgi:hypothetical protein